MENKLIKSGFVSLIGRPNVGKSTFLNSFLGRKISIVSDKPQTTRVQIVGIYTEEKGQIIFLDNPGIHKPLHKLNQSMMEYVYNALEESDIILFLIDITQKFGKGDEFALNLLKKYKKTKFLLINKLDIVTKSKALPIIEKFKDSGIFDEIIPISALKAMNFDLINKKIFDYLPKGPLFYPADSVTTTRRKFFISEIIREKILLLTHDELPFSVAVLVKDIEQRENGVLYISADIYVEKDSQKAIIIGKKGSMITRIGKLARKELSFLTDKKIYLDLYVKVKERWRDSMTVLSQINKQMGED
jgi:GTP-binding protein Era